MADVSPLPYPVGFINGIERLHRCIEHPAQRSGVVSKSLASLAMIERRGYPVRPSAHVNKEAASEMYRLPIHAGGFLALT